MWIGVWLLISLFKSEMLWRSILGSPHATSINCFTNVYWQLYSPKESEVAKGNHTAFLPSPPTTVTTPPVFTLVSCPTFDLLITNKMESPLSASQVHYQLRFHQESQIEQKIILFQRAVGLSSSVNIASVKCHCMFHHVFHKWNAADFYMFAMNDLT